MPKSERATLVAAEIRSRRRALEWNQTKLAERAGVEFGTISRIERGFTKHARVETITAIDDALEAGGAIVAIYSGMTSSDSQVAHTGHAGAGETPSRQEGTGVDDPFGGLRLRWKQLPKKKQVPALAACEAILDSFLNGGTTGHRVATRKRG